MRMSEIPGVQAQNKCRKWAEIKAGKKVGGKTKNIRRSKVK